MAGIPSMSSIYMAHRTSNFIRIANLPDNRLAKVFLNSEYKENTGTSAFNFYKKDLLAIRNWSQHSSTDHDTLERALGYLSRQNVQDLDYRFSHKDCKRHIKAIVFNHDRILTVNRLKHSRSKSLLSIFNSIGHHPILSEGHKSQSNLISWIIGSTLVLNDRAGISSSPGINDKCRFCWLEPETRRHLLTDCYATVHLITRFSNCIKVGISEFKFNEFMSLSDRDKWLWILGGGVLPIKIQPTSYRLQPITSVFALANSVTTGFDRGNQLQAENAFFEFKEIEHSFSANCICAYTDGSFKRIDGKVYAGSGAVVHQNSIKIREITTPAGCNSITFAELLAFLSVLRWARDSGCATIGEKRNFHFITDSQTVVSMLTRNTIPKAHFYIIQEIKHYAISLSETFNFRVHWIPSHLDRYSFGRNQIQGNIRADTLANIARELSINHPLSKQVQEGNIEHIRTEILGRSRELLDEITNMLDRIVSPLMARLRT